MCFPEDARWEVDKLIDALQIDPVGTCCRCGAPMAGCMGGALADIEQAFEACNSSSVLNDWALVSEKALATTPATEPRILSRRGERHRYLFPARHHGEP